MSEFFIIYCREPKQPIQRHDIYEEPHPLTAFVRRHAPSGTPARILREFDPGDWFAGEEAEFELSLFNRQTLSISRKKKASYVSEILRIVLDWCLERYEVVGVRIEVHRRSDPPMIKRHHEASTFDELVGMIGFSSSRDIRVCWDCGAPDNHGADASEEAP
jgi:hypothetical protein